MDSLQLRACGFFVVFLVLCCEASSPLILPVCFAAFAFAIIYVITYQKKQSRSFVDLLIERS